MIKKGSGGIQIRDQSILQRVDQIEMKLVSQCLFAEELTPIIGKNARKNAGSSVAHYGRNLLYMRRFGGLFR